MASAHKLDVSPYSVEIHVDGPFQESVPCDLLRCATFRTLAHQHLEGHCELTIVVTDDETLHKLNRQHRDVDAPTDVLAFANEEQDGFVFAPGQPRYLGDVIISFPRAARQAAEAGHGVRAELQLLTVHGVLHLVGYDDLTEASRARMWAAQAEILQDLGVDIRPPA